MGQYVVYADVLWAINFFLDLVLLYGTAHFGRFPCRWRRLIPAAAIGGFYGVLMLAPQLSMFYNFFWKIAFSLIMIWLAFGLLSLKSFFRAVFIFYIIGFAMAGAVLGGSSLLANTPLSAINLSPFNMVALLFALGMALLMARFGIVWFRRQNLSEDMRISCEVILHGRNCRLRVLLDTGNELCDPMTGKAVMVAEYAALRSILPERFCRLYEKYGARDVVQLMEKCGRVSPGCRLRLLPYNSIGKENGMLVAFVPDMVIFGAQKEMIMDDVLIGLYHRALTNKSGCQAVVNPAVLNWPEKGENLWASGV